MKKFKLYDTWISIALISGSVIYGLIKMDHTFVAGYLVVGAWQLISIFIHIYSDWFIKESSKRRRYNKVVLFTFIALALAFVLPFLLFLILFLLLFAAPFMAVYYTTICYEEVYVKMQRPLTLLK